MGDMLRNKFSEDFGVKATIGIFDWKKLNKKSFPTKPHDNKKAAAADAIEAN